jgi:ElaB/YqjD/DUF883 family membrane-anchored ribosome-binding protein
MEKAAAKVYADLLRQLAKPDADHSGVADLFREVERMHLTGRITDWQLENAREAYARTVAGTGSRIGEPVSWAKGKAKATLHSAGDRLRERATTAMATYTKQDPVRAVLIAAGTGALLMLLLAKTVRSEVRSVKRRVGR